MSTPAQIAANRENAKLSTGPTTEAGKAKSSRNNTQHNLTARGLIVLPGQEPAFNELEEDLRANLLPQGATQEIFFTRILEASWNLHRCRLAEAQLYVNSDKPEVDPLVDDDIAVKLERIHKYARQNENSLTKCLRELSKLQTEIQYRHEVYPLTQEQIDDPEEFDQSPHALSDVCNYRKVMDSFLRQHAAKSRVNRQNQRGNAAFFAAHIHALGKVDDFQLEADEAEAKSKAA